MPAPSPAPASTPAPHSKRPRHWANDLVDAWVDGRSAEPILARLSQADQQLARAHARAHCIRIKHYAAHPDDLVHADAGMRDWVERYLERME